MAGARISGASAAIREALQRAGGGLHAARLMVRVPTLATHPRAWTLVLFGSATVATGFLVGSVYVVTSGRPGPPVLSPAREVVSAIGASGSVPAPGKAAEPALAATISDSAQEPTFVASADSSRPSAPPTAQPVERKADQNRSARARRETASAAQTKPAARVAAAPEVATTGFATVPGDEGITSVPLPAKARATATKARSAQAVVGGTDSAGSPTPSGTASIKGTLFVKSDPQGAEVSINGVVHGRTPLMIRDLSVGSRVVRLELPGYQRWSWAVSVVANKRTPLNVKLRPESAGVGPD
jgi:hypothetical protein